MAVLAAAMLAVPAGPAGAHALVRSSDPADGALLDAAPGAVLVTFTEPPDPALSSLHVLGQTGGDVASGPSGRVPGAPLDLRIPLPGSLPNGVYTVTWRAVSRTDGHVTAGSFSFGIGVQPAETTGSQGPVAPTSPPVPPLAVAGRWAFYWGLAILLGGAAARLAWRLPLPDRGRWTEGAWLLGLGWLICSAGLVAMIVAERAVIGISVGSFLSSGTGRSYVERSVALGVAGVAAIPAARREGRGPALVLGAAVAAAMLVHALAGHAAVSAPVWFNAAVQWLHLMAVGVWIGGLPWVLLAVRAGDGEERARTVRRYSMMAGLALLVVVVTGISRLLDELGWPASWARFFDTSFGVALLVKIGLVAGLVLLGARNRYRNVPRAVDPAGAAGLRRTVAAEVVVASLILAATGLMSEVAPAATVAQAARRPVPPAQVVVSGSDFATTVRVRLSATPGSVGPNRFEVRISDFDTARPVDASAVSLSFRLPGRPELGTQRLDLSPATPGLWTGRGTVLSMDGRWSVAVTIQQPAGGVEVPLMLQTRLPPEQIQTIPGASGQPTLYQIRLAGGASMQGYVDPGLPGQDVVHFTFFDAAGDELPLASATATRTPPQGAAGPLDLLRFSAGHFVANTALTAGTWRFQIVATARDGAVYQVYFQQRIG